MNNVYRKRKPLKKQITWNLSQTSQFLFLLCALHMVCAQELTLFLAQACLKITIKIKKIK